MSSVDGGSATPPTADVPKSWHARQCSGGCGRELAARTADPSANVFCDVCHPGRLPLEPVETRHLDARWQLWRKPAYDAVYAYIGGLGEALPTEPVRRNAMIWRAVNGALDALDHSGVAGEPEATPKEASESAQNSGPTPTHAPTPETPGAVNVAGAPRLPAELRGDGPCHDCGAEDNIVWFAENVLWNHVMGGPGTMDDPGGIVCIPCFVIRVDKAGLAPTGWRLLPEWRWMEASRG